MSYKFKILPIIYSEDIEIVSNNLFPASVEFWAIDLLDFHRIIVGNLGKLQFSN